MLQFWWPSPDLASQMNKFEQVFSDHHQISLGRGYLGLMSRGLVEGVPRFDVQGVRARGCPGLMSMGEGTLPCGLSHDTFDVTYPLLWTDRCRRNHYLCTITSFAGGNKNITWNYSHLVLQIMYFLEISDIYLKR